MAPGLRAFDRIAVIRVRAPPVRPCAANDGVDAPPDGIAIGIDLAKNSFQVHGAAGGRVGCVP